MKNKLQKISIILFLGFVFSSCATLFLGTEQKVTLNSEPQGADVYVNGNSINKQTPCDIKIPKKNPESSFNKKNEVVYTLKKEGYSDIEYRNISKVNGLIYLDYFFYIIPGLVDNGTKAHRIYEKEIALNLKPLEKRDLIAPIISITYPKVSRGFKSI